MNADADKKAKEEVEKYNLADSTIFQTEKQLKEYGDKIPAEKKTPIESALKDLKEAHGARDFAKMETSLTALNSAWEAASKELYDAMNAQQQQQGPQQDGAQNNTTNPSNPGARFIGNLRTWRNNSSFPSNRAPC